MSVSTEDLEGDGENEGGDSENPRFAALIEALAMGEAIDWQQAESSAGSAEELEQIRALAAISEVATFHRTWLAEGGIKGDLDEDEEPEDEAPTHWGELEIIERVGRGSFGDVYKAREPRLDRIVALKLIRASAKTPEREAETLREGRLLAKVRHPNVATVHGAAGADGRVGFWMEFLEGKNLAEILAEKGRFEPREAAEIGIALCRALAAVHAQGIVHRDVKAQNVVRENDGRIVLTDFGVGRDATVHQTEEPSLSGTPLYLAPELFEGKPPSPASDLYALGVLLFYLVTGEFPITGSSFDELKAAHQGRKRRWLKELRKDLPGSFVAAVERALDRDPEKRGDEAGMERELGRFIGERLERKRRIRQMLAASVLLSLLAGGIFAYLERDQIEAQVHLYRADRYHEKGAREDTIRELKKAKFLAPDVPGIYWRLMSYQSADGDYDAAFQTADDSAKLCEKSHARDCYLVKGWSALLRLDYKAALENFKTVKSIRPDEETQSQIVQLQINLLQTSVAIQEARALVGAKGIGEASVLVSTLSAAGRHLDALEELEVLRKRFGDDPQIHWTAGTVLTAAGRYAPGENEFKLVAEQPEEVGDLSIGQLSLAQSLILQGKCDRAQGALAVSPRLNSQEDFARNDAIRALLLAKCSVLMGDREEASRILQSIERLRHIPAYLKIFRNAALEALEARDVVLSERFAGIVSNLNVKSHSDLSQSFDFQLRGELAWKEGNSTAVSLLEKATDLRGDPQNLLSLARVLIENGQCLRASKYLAELTRSRGLIVADFYTPWAIWSEAVALRKRCPE